MQTVILGSERFDCLAGLLERDPGDTPAVYVPTAADVLDDRAYVQEEIRRLAGMGFPVTALPLAGASRERVTAQLRRARLVFVTGGNAFHLLHHAMLSGFTELVPPLVRCGVLIYVGMSAGAHLATPDLLPCVSEDTRWKAPGLAARPGRHDGDGTRVLLGACPLRRSGPGGPPSLAAPQPRRIVPVTDEQLIVVRGSRWSIIPAVP